jgi:hypothetical protein
MRLLYKYRFAVPLSFESNLAEDIGEHDSAPEVRRV